MKVGLIGCGGIAPMHIRVYKNLKDVEFVSLCDLNIDRAKKLSKQFNVEKVYTNYFEMFEKEHLDVVDICTPVSTHAKIACDAAEHVPAILLEKPMALNVSQCDEIIRAIRKRGRKLCIGHSQIFSPLVQKTKKMVDSGDFGLHSFSTIQKESFEILKSFDLAPEWNVLPQQRGIIWEVCCHLAYLQLYFLPDIKDVYAVGSKVRYLVYDDFAVLLRGENGRFGIIELSWLSRETETIYEFRDVTDRRIQIHWEFDYMLENKQTPPFSMGLVLKNMFEDQKRLWKKWYRFGSCYIHKRKLLPAFNLIGGFIESVRKDLPSPVTEYDGRNTINLLESIEKSLDQEKSISIK
jgi:predicted dehydrogenase